MSVPPDSSEPQGRRIPAGAADPPCGFPDRREHPPGGGPLPPPIAEDEMHDDDFPEEEDAHDPPPPDARTAEAPAGWPGAAGGWPVRPIRPPRR